MFATLAMVEQRPVGEVIEECLADLAAHLLRGRSRHSLHLDTQDTAALNVYLDGVEIIEREEEEAVARVATTPAMHAQAHASDMREAYPLNEEQAEFLHRCQGAGFVEMTLAMEA